MLTNHGPAATMTTVKYTSRRKKDQDTFRRKNACQNITGRTTDTHSTGTPVGVIALTLIAPRTSKRKRSSSLSSAPKITNQHYNDDKSKTNFKTTLRSTTP